MRYLKKFESRVNELDYETFQEIFLDISDNYDVIFDRKSKMFSIDIHLDLQYPEYLNDYWKYRMVDINDIKKVFNNSDTFIEEVNKIKKNWDKLKDLIDIYDNIIKDRLKKFINFSEVKFNKYSDRIEIKIILL
jgi:hypothetical protein